ncbi:unnamed protein product [Lupinus luteus]|uniref:Uncharacterized protein n=1 Tax=Lupinus luteus TaxID=3873 RepID=A0AAV1YLR7_LUPLU
MDCSRMIEVKWVQKWIESSTSWAPTQTHIYNRPNNHNNEIDPVELQHMLLNHKIR